MPGLHASSYKFHADVPFIKSVCIVLVGNICFPEEEKLHFNHFTMDSETVKLSIKILNQDNKMLLSKKQMRAKLRKIKKKKKKILYQCQSQKTGTFTNDLSSNSEKEADSILLSKINVLTEEWFLTKQSEVTLKNENLDLKKSIQNITEDNNMKKEIITRLKQEKNWLDSYLQTGQTELSNLKQTMKRLKKITEDNKMQAEIITRLKKEKNMSDLKIQTEITDLKQIINKNTGDEDILKTKISEYHKEIANLRCLIQKLKGGKFNPDQFKIKQLNSQLRQLRKEKRNLHFDLISCKKLIEEQKKTSVQKNGKSAFEYGKQFLAPIGAQGVIML